MHRGAFFLTNMIIKEKKDLSEKKGAVCSNSTPGVLFRYPFFCECAYAPLTALESKIFLGGGGGPPGPLITIGTLDQTLRRGSAMLITCLPARNHTLQSSLNNPCASTTELRIMHISDFFAKTHSGPCICTSMQYSVI